MRETIIVNGIKCDVDYNDLIFSRNDIVKALKVATTDKFKLDDMEECDLLNYEEVVSQIKPKNVETRTVDCTGYANAVQRMAPLMIAMGGSAKFGKEPLADTMKKTFGFTEAKDLGNNVYELTGTKKAFSALKRFL